MPMLGSARWIKQVSDQLDQADQASTQLKTGALAWLGGGDVELAVPMAALASPQGARADHPARPEAVNPMSADGLPSQFLLHADGIGSFLILRQPIVTIGPISSSLVPDVAVVAEPTLAPVTIHRVEDDYFLKAGGRGSDVPSRRLLTPGERIVLSPRCRLTFQLPSAASTSAALDLTGARLPRSDIRRVILMDRDVIIGPSPASHVVAPGLAEPLILHVRQDQLFCQSRQPMTINGQPACPNAAVPLGQTIKTAGLSFVLSRVPAERR
jgi:hypothetical protein